MADMQINPLPQAIGVHMAYVAQAPTVLVMKERLSLSGDDFTVRTVDGRDIVRCDGKALSMSQRKAFYSPDGQLLWILRKQVFSFPKSWYLEAPSGDHFCTIDSKLSFGKAKLDVHFINSIGDGTDAFLQVRGDFFDRSADVTCNGTVVAKIRREFFNMREMFGGHQTYGVEVAPGMDLALIATVVIGLDESQNEH